MPSTQVLPAASIAPILRSLKLNAIAPVPLNVADMVSESSKLQGAVYKVPSDDGSSYVPKLAAVASAEIVACGSWINVVPVSTAAKKPVFGTDRPLYDRDET